MDEHIDSDGFYETGKLNEHKPEGAESIALNGCEVLDQRRLPFNERKGLSEIEDTWNKRTWDPNV